MTGNEYLRKAEQTLSAARLLLDNEDVEGACNRAYYAMFDAARAALLASGHDVGKTHKGVLNAFSDRLVKNGPLPKEMGRLLKHAETFRYVADYEGGPVELSDAKDMAEQAETFVSAMRAEFMPSDPDDNRSRTAA